MILPSKTEAANPDLKTEVLRIGQELDLVVPKPYLTVQTKEKTTFTQSIPYPTRTLKDANLYIYERKVQKSGVAGSKEVTWEIVRENGQESRKGTSRENCWKNPSPRWWPWGPRCQRPGEREP